MNELNQKLIIALIVIPILLGIFRSPKVMWISVAAIGLALCFSNLDKLKKFKGAGFEVEVRKAVTEAYAAIEELKELGVALSEPIVDELAVSGKMFSYIPLKYKLERIEKIAKTLAKLGATQDEIDEVCSTMYDRVTDDHKKRILHNLKSLNPEKKTLLEGFEKEKLDDLNQSKIKILIKENKLNKNEETDDLFLDLEYFIKNKKLRREDKWQS